MSARWRRARSEIQRFIRLLEALLNTLSETPQVPWHGSQSLLRSKRFKLGNDRVELGNKSSHISNMSDEDDAEIFRDCQYCSGERGCPRASAGSLRCSAGKCKKQQAAERAAAKVALNAVLTQDDEPARSAAAPRFCFQIKDVVGVSMCKDRLDSKERRVGRDREDEDIQYQVRGKFGDDSDEDLDDMVPDTRWVKLSELVQKIDEPGCAALGCRVTTLELA